VRIEKVSIGKLSVQYCLTPTFRDRLNRNLTLLHRLEDLIVDLESLYQYAKDKLEEKESINSELTKVRQTSPYEHKDPREVNFRIPKIKNETEIVTRVRNPTYLDFLYRPQIN
jgi:SPX domain protein involved in polyphosphate accumulation